MMHKSLTILFLLTFVFPQVAWPEDWPSVPFLVVEGRAFVDVPPENATITLSVIAFEEESEVAVATVQQQVIGVLDVLENFAVPADSITSFSLRKNVERARQDYRDLEILGYYVTRKIEAELADISRFSDLVAALAVLDNVSQIDAKFDVNDRDNIEAALTREAAIDARREAGNIAGAMGVSIGNVYAISTTEFHSGGTIYGLGSRFYASVSSPKPYKDTVFLPATITIWQSLHIVFEIDQ